MINRNVVSQSVCRMLLAVTLAVGFACQSFAQFGFGFNNRVGVVGGVSVDAEGAVRNVSQSEQLGWLKDMRSAVAEPSQGVAPKSDLRMISLTKLQAEIQSAIEADRPLSEDVLYLAGLQRIEYLFVYPEQADIVIAGPAEGWIVREDASVVGNKSGRPVLHLEDLLTALRTTEAARQAAISVSIDPTPEGEMRLVNLLKQVRAAGNVDPRTWEQSMREAFGPQQVKLTTVASDSRMAQTLVAADYRMKRLAMNLDEPQVAGLPSYMEMVRNGGGSQATQPRWWMACDYDAILHSEDRTAWKLSGLGVKAMTEDELVSAEGQRTATGKANQQAQRWADLFTAKFDELCGINAAFGDLRNAMDLNIIATVIHGHELEQLAGCDLSLLTGISGQLRTPSWKTPKTISPECSFVKGRAGWTVSASGGVEVNPWKVVSQLSKTDQSVVAVRQKAAPEANTWWW